MSRSQPPPANRFEKQLSAYKKLINSDIEAYCEQISLQTVRTYGQHSEAVSLAYSDILRRGGKRMRGTLTCVGYEMCGGTNKEVMLQAARAIEMMHAYILIIDDIQDRSALRRGGKSAHKLLEESHKKQKWQGSAEHAGMSLALNAALLGLHGAELVLSNLDVTEDLRLKALNIMNHTMIVTLHGQTNDIVNELRAGVSEKDLDSVMQWKTAHYSFLNPLHMGMVLAGAPCEDTNAITRYALKLGKAFQILDDLLVVAENSEGKDPIDDIREGKQNLLTVYALKHASRPDVVFLKKCLGNQNLKKPDFERCKTILLKSGAVDYARKTSKDYIKEAQTSLRDQDRTWNEPSVEFLDSLAEYMLAHSA